MKQDITHRKDLYIVLAFVAVVFTPHKVFPEEDSQEQEKPANESHTKDEDKIINKAQLYAEAVSCATSEKSFKPLRVTSSGEANGKSNGNTYFVLWVGTIGCQEHFTIGIAVVHDAPGPNFYVDPQKSSPNVAVKAPTHSFEKVVEHSQRSITLRGHKYQDIPGNAGYHKEILLQFTLKLNDKGNWNVAEKEEIRTKKVKNIME